ncbi:TIGR02302 family protein [Rhodobacteraceae bacterium CCMM004]|nr:TIGR02302 family protein [Rhodobacteraceae bacterium CCMM004]
MTQSPQLPDAARRGLRRPLALTRAGMAAERGARAFWPLWSIALATVAVLMLGLHEAASLEAVWIGAVAVALGAVWAVWRAWRIMAWPTEAEALEQLDAALPGRPIAAISDTQAIGAGDAASRAVWEAHLTRMAARVRAARAQAPNLRLSGRDPYALRYVALTAFAVAVLFGSVLRIGSVAEMTPGGGGQALAAGPAWEGWIEPPAYTGKPSLYLADLPAGEVAVPEGSRLTLRLYGEVGALTVAETVSTRTGDRETAEAPAQSFDVAQSGEVRIDGPGGRSWDIAMLPDAPPSVTVTDPMERAAGGEFQQPFSASDDHGVVAGRVTIALDAAALDRRHGLTAEPDPREAIVVDLPMPITGDRSEFTETLIENFSEHAWANMPVTLTFEVTDALGQTGGSAPISTDLAGLRFFDPMAQAVVEQRRDLLWSRANAARVAQILRAVSYRPDDVFSSETLYLRLRVAIRRLEAGLDVVPLSPERQEEIAQALWDIALELEYGDMADALERLRRAQDRLSEAMENGASDAEIAELMQELREAMQDYMRQLAEQAQRDGNQQAQDQGEMQEITGDQLQDMMDRIQELMEQGRMEEAQRLLDQLRQMMENMQVTQGQPGQGQPSPGEQAMEGLAETLRNQQGLSDEAFRDLQEQFNPNAQAGENQGNRGQSGNMGQGQEHSQGQGEGQGQNRQGQQGQQGQEGQTPGGGETGDPGESLADRQQALRDELNRQQQNLPGAGTAEGDAAREALDRAGDAMDGAEEALRENDYADALDHQSDAMEALREGMRNLGEQMAQQQQQQNGQGQAAAEGDPQGLQRDPLGRNAGAQGRLGTDENLLQGEDVYRRAEELLDEIRRRSGDQTRPEQERDYLRRLLDKF